MTDHRDVASEGVASDQARDPGALRPYPLAKSNWQNQRGLTVIVFALVVLLGVAYAVYDNATVSTQRAGVAGSSAQHEGVAQALPPNFKFEVQFGKGRERLDIVLDDVQEVKVLIPLPGQFMGKTKVKWTDAPEDFFIRFEGLAEQTVKPGTTPDFGDRGAYFYLRGSRKGQPFTLYLE